MHLYSAKAFFWVVVAWMAATVVCAQPHWQMVVPAKPYSERSNLAQVFASRLKTAGGAPVPVQEALRYGGARALQEVVAAQGPPYSLVLMSEELAVIGNVAHANAQHLSNYETLLVFLETRWCLFVRTDSPITEPGQLLQWARLKNTAPRIAIPVTSGRLRLWVQGMAQRTGRAWQMDAYGIGEEFVTVLEQGTDVALGHCEQQWPKAHRMRILAKGTQQEDNFMPQVPKFVDLGWMPLGNGWMAWMVPKTVPVADRQFMAEQLRTVTLQPAVQAFLRGTDLVPLSLSVPASVLYIQDFIQTWNQIGHLLLGDDFGDLRKMQGLAKPAL